MQPVRPIPNPSPRQDAEPDEVSDAIVLHAR